jgi:hypothetical protein
MGCALKEISSNLLSVLYKLVEKTNCGANICCNQNKVEVNLIWKNKKIRISDNCSSVVFKRLQLLLANK